MRPFLIACALLLCGCASYIQKRNINRLGGYSIRYPAEMAKLSNQLYPCFNGKAKSDTVIVHGKADTTFLKGDTTVIIKHDTVFKTITKPSLRIVIPDYITIHDTIPDNRALQACSLNAKIKADSLLIVKTQYGTADKKANLYFWILIAISAVILGVTVIKAYKFFSGGAVTNVAGDILKKL